MQPKFQNCFAVKPFNLFLVAEGHCHSCLPTPPILCTRTAYTSLLRRILFEFPIFFSKPATKSILLTHHNCEAQLKLHQTYHLHPFVGVACHSHGDHCSAWKCIWRLFPSTSSHLLTANGKDDQDSSALLLDSSHEVRYCWHLASDTA